MGLWLVGVSGVRIRNFKCFSGSEPQQGSGYRCFVATVVVTVRDRVRVRVRYIFE